MNKNQFFALSPVSSVTLGIFLSITKYAPPAVGTTVKTAVIYIDKSKLKNVISLPIISGYTTNKRSLFVVFSPKKVISFQ